MSNDVVLDKETLRDYMFNKKIAKCKFIMEDNKEVGFALYFYNFSTFKGRAGLYLEDTQVLLALLLYAQNTPAKECFINA